jgi:hypothetical protein
MINFSEALFASLLLQRRDRLSGRGSIFADRRGEDADLRAARERARTRK